MTKAKRFYILYYTIIRYSLANRLNKGEEGEEGEEGGGSERYRGITEMYLRVHIPSSFGHARSRAQLLAWSVTLSAAGGS